MPPKRSPWAMAASLALQCSVIGAVVLVSILHIEKLGIDLLKPPPLRVPMPKPIEAVEIVGVVRSGVVRSTAAVLQYTKVFQPTTIPKDIAIIDDGGQTLPAIGSGESRPGVPGSPIGFDGGIVTNVPAPPPPPPQPKDRTVSTAPPKEPVRVTSSLAEAMLIHRVIPPYPPIAKQMRVSGRVRLLGVISTSGQIEKLEVLEGHPLLVKAALDAVKQWIYKPTMLNGQPVPVMAPIEVNFILN